MNAISISYIVTGAILTAPIVALITQRSVIALRKSEYEAANRAAVEDPFPLPDLHTTRALPELSDDDRRLASLFATEHARGKSLQDKTVAHLVAASMTLLVAFAISAASVTVIPHEEGVHLYAGFLDLGALLTVIWAFRASGRNRAAWIRQRIATEFLRQWAATRFLRPIAPGSIEERFEAEAEEIRAGVEGTERRLAATAARIGAARLIGLEKELSSPDVLKSAPIAQYLSYRAIRQVRWFAKSSSRIGVRHARRRWIMMGLYTVCLASALAKCASIMVGEQVLSQWASFALLLSIGIAGASTSAYLGQNIRSLKHRYETQLRRFEHWFNEHGGAFASEQDPATLKSGRRTRVVAAVVAFERSMTDELVDWISITVDDAMELAPA